MKSTFVLLTEDELHWLFRKIQMVRFTLKDYEMADPICDKLASSIRICGTRIGKRKKKAHAKKT